jgi:protein-ribulosamine 3-kinase
MGLQPHQIAAATGIPCGSAKMRPLPGGGISEVAVLENATARYFVKHHPAERLDMLVAEAEGLEALRRAAVVRVPTPLGSGAAAGRAFLVLEYLALRPAGDAAQEALGRGLAAQHRITRPRFGWHRDNAIGSTPQRNGDSTDWGQFWSTQRLGFQLQRAAGVAPRRSLVVSGERLLAHVDALFAGYRPPASLLHGDLWNGNVAQTAAGQPVIYDPAVYYGDRETDVAMTELFGGFSERFYRAYREAWPLDDGYDVRRDLYNLYHVLNHANLFGGGYWLRSERLIAQLLAQIR